MKELNKTYSILNKRVKDQDLFKQLEKQHLFKPMESNEELCRLVKEISNMPAYKFTFERTREM